MTKVNQTGWTVEDKHTYKALLGAGEREVQEDGEDAGGQEAGHRGSKEHRNGRHRLR